MTTPVILQGGLVTYQGSGFQALDATIVETINRDDVMPDHKQYMSIMDFNDTKLINPSQTFAAKAAPKGLSDVLETGLPVSQEMIFTPKKGVYQVEIAGKYSRSFAFTKWAEQSKTIEGAPGEIQAELLLAASEARDLALAYDVRYAEEMVKLFSKGFSITAPNGPGSATPKGKALFDTHTYGVTGSAVSGTFTNFTNGAFTFDPNNSTDLTNGTTRLQTLINQLKIARDENGKFVRQVGPYKLFCSRLREVFWKAVLNNSSKFSGQGSNAMKENQFLFAGNIVELVVLDLLGQADYAGTTIGTTDYIFVTNSGSLKQAQAIRTYRLYPLTIESWKNMDTKVLTTDGRASIGVDHYGAELYVAGSTCA